jgi:hypothetical protein
MNGWKQYAVTQKIEANRNGWPGVWDALKSAVTNQPRFTVSTPVTLSFWAKTDKPDTKIEYNIAQVQAEIGEGWDG